MKYYYTAVPGSSLLIIFFITTALLVAGAALWRSTTLMIEVSHKRQRYTQLTYLTESLLQFGVALSTQQMRYLLSEAQSGKNTHTISLDAWPPNDTTYAGTLTIQALENSLLLKAVLQQKGELICGAQCMLQYTIDVDKNLTALSVNGWAFNVS